MIQGNQKRLRSPVGTPGFANWVIGVIAFGVFLSIVLGIGILIETERSIDSQDETVALNCVAVNETQETLINIIKTSEVNALIQYRTAVREGDTSPGFNSKIIRENTQKFLDQIKIRDCNE